MPDIDLQEMLLRRSTPVVINSFNQLTYVRAMVEGLKAAGFRNLYILDQASTHPPLVEWLSGTQQRDEAVTLFQAENRGPHHFFLTQMYDLFGGAPLLYTDPDLGWEQLAPDFLTGMFALAHRYRVFKVGPALTIPTPAQMKPGLKTIQEGSIGMTVAEYEQRYWQTEVEPGVYNAPIDTTMHLFVPYYYQHGSPLITGLRVARPGFALKHQPWFSDDPMPADEYAYYLSRTTHTTWRPDPA